MKRRPWSHRLPLVVLMFLMIPLAAQAGLKVCNETGQKRNVAIAYKDGDQWLSIGWWIIPPGDCSRVVKGKLKQRYYYYRATTRKGDFEGDRYLFCTQREPFEIYGADDCKARGYRNESFRKIDTGKRAKDFTFTLGDDKPAKQAQTVEPGHYGEPLTISGRFTGCDRIDGVLSCSLRSAEWNYRVMDDGRSPSALLERLDALTINQRIIVSGDLVAEGDLANEMTLRSLEVERPPADVKSRLAQQLIGPWRSYSDAKNLVRFDDAGGHYEYYEGKLMHRSRFEITAQCGEMRGTADSPLLKITSAGDEEPYCYGIESVDENQLKLMYLPRGNMLEYFRESE